MRITRKNLYEINYWPGFVDVLGTLLIVTIFTVLISTITQIYFNDQLEVKRGEISNLDEEINNLIEQLGGVTKKNKDHLTTQNIFVYIKKHFNINNSKLIHNKAVYKRHSNDIKIDVSIAILLHNLNQPYILTLLFE